MYQQHLFFDRKTTTAVIVPTKRSEIQICRLINILLNEFLSERCTVRFSISEKFTEVKMPCYFAQ